MSSSGVELYNITITKMVLSNFDRTKSYDVSSSYANLRFIASIFQPTIRGEISLADSYQLIEEMPMLGEEWLDIEYQSITGDLVTLNLFVYRTSNDEMTSSNNTKTYKLHFVERDQLFAISHTIERSYNAQYSDIAIDILKNVIKSDNDLNIEPSRGIQQIIVPFLNAWETMEFIRQRSFSRNFKSPFVFFQDFKGYNFCSIEFLIAQRKGNADNKLFYYEFFSPDAGSVQEQYKTRLPKHFKNITNLQVLKKNDSTETINQGGYQAHTLVHDIITKEIKTVSNTNLQSFSSKVEPLGNNIKPLHSTKFLKLMQDKGSYQYVIPYDSSTSPTHMDELLLNKQFFNTLMKQIHIKFDAPLDSSINPGDIIAVKIPSSAHSDKGSDNEQLSGKYFVGAVSITIQDNRGFMQLDCYKHGFESVVTR